jgi:hypothetical protein
MDLSYILVYCSHDIVNFMVMAYMASLQGNLLSVLSARTGASVLLGQLKCQLGIYAL